MDHSAVRWLATAVATVALIGALPGAAAAANPRGKGPDLPVLRDVEPVPVSPVRFGGDERPDQAVPGSPAAEAVWPGPGRISAHVHGDGVNSRKSRANALRKQSDGAESGGLDVTVAGREKARAAGIDGVLFSVAEPGTGDAVTVDVSLDYSSFAKAFGGDWASRLTLVRLPGCALTTPENAECRTPEPLASANEPGRGTVSAEVEVPARPAAVAKNALAAPMVLAATAGASGPSGDYRATSLAPSGSWSGGGSTGAFTWSYPMNVPSVPGGLQPSIALGYNSQSVDGRTSASNNQGGWLGDGWSYEPGFIERRYKACDEDRSGGTNTAKVGDLCWYTDNAVLSLGGKNTELVYQAGKGWHPANDSGEKVEKLTGAANGDNDGEHWKVTATDGTQYFFGLNRLPGYTAGAAETKSAWTVPVFGNQSGEPCYNASFAGAWCQQAWRWQLDYVVDPRGNAMAYYWNTESNNYARNWSSTTGKGTATPYVRGGWLDRVEYGLRSDTVYSAKPMGVVKFDVDERCLANCGTFDEANARNWPDVPFDLYCADGADCKSNASPTFWSRKRLTAVTTRLLTGGAHQDVDSWSLAQGFPPAGDGVSTPMWLSSLTRSGRTNGSLALPPVTFAGEQLANRVDRTGDGLAPFVRLRLSQVTTETGGTIGAYYSAPGCTVTSLPAANASNTTRCYPVKRREGDTVKDDWFNSYVVEKVVEGDNLAATPDTVTEYAYLDGAAWAKNEDEFTSADLRTYSVGRGYGRVQTRTGAGYDARTLTETRFLRGIDGAQVSDSAGAAVTDRPEFAGQIRERAVYNGDGGALVSATSYTPWRSAEATASRTRDGLPALSAYFTGVEQERTRSTTGGGERRTSLSRTFDGHGMVSTVSEQGDEAVGGDERCTTTSYARNTATGLLNLPSRVEVTGAACGLPVNRPADVVSDTVQLYDDTTAVGAAPTKGLLTETRAVNGAGTGYDTLSRTGYDAYGRPLTATDAYGKTATTRFTPAAGEPATGVVVTNALGHATTTAYDPLRGQALTITDANNKVTSSRYDALGRVTGIWLPTRLIGTYPDSPNHRFEYQVRNDGPVVVTSSTLQHDSTYETGYSFYDGLLRARQTQRTSPDRSGRLVTEQSYDTRGLAWRDSGSYYADGAAEGVLVTGQELKYPASTDTLYDGAARPTAVVAKRFGDETRRTTTTYHGDAVTVVPPKGGTSKTTWSDVRGNVVEMKEYTDEARTAGQSVTYQYDKRGKVVRMNDPAGNEWRYAYDVRGQLVRAEDPDKGTSELTVDIGGRVTDVKDARGVVLHTDYDALGRTTALKQGATTLAAWTYDTVAKGQPATSTRYAGGAAYTTAVTAYNSLYKPTATQVTIPVEEGALAGTYKWTTAYNANTGQVAWQQQPALGGLPAERVTTAYTPTTGLPATSYAGSDPIVSASTYDHYGRTLRDEYGAFGSHLWASYEYDEHTGSLLRAVTDRETAPQRIDDNRYTYDAVGNVTSTSTRSGQDAAAVTDTQCVVTDALRRITEAWTAASGTCAPAPSASAVGGPDAYWTSFGYDGVGNRRSEVRHGLGGAADTVRGYTPVPGRPNALAEVSQTGPAGTLKETYAYDATGNTTRRTVGSAPAQTLEWDPQGRLAKLTGTGTDNAYVYDADGNRLIRKDSTGTTVYLPGGNELKLARGGSTPVGTRYYAYNGRTAAVRSAGRLSFVLADPHGTATVHVDAATQAVTRRKTTLFGAERGTAPGTGWVGDRGFLGGTRDGDSGLTHLGAREYDPNTGRFISVDPKMDATASQEMGAYTYANNNPLATSDPSGEALPECYSGQYTCDNRGTRPTGYGSNYLSVTFREGGTPAPAYCVMVDCSPPPPVSNKNGNLDTKERKARADYLSRIESRSDKYYRKTMTREQMDKENRSFAVQFNSAERETCDRDLLDCVTYMKEAVVSMTNTKLWLGTNDGEKANAFRHVLWQANLTLKLGQTKAQAFGEAHEMYYADKEEADHRADLLNNEFGQELGKRVARESNGNISKAQDMIIAAAKEYVNSDHFARASDME
ncbi:RHS repeat-associated core domain-containing protein [Kitasatospora sp. NPDC056184]|uniref:RHS repeat domain-containing protein n=1 Tax=Kitasatospora sp. NPDC056184 TaxID=3345738 RepID=UPI0035D71E54